MFVLSLAAPISQESQKGEQSSEMGYIHPKDIGVTGLSFSRLQLNGSYFICVQNLLVSCLLF